MITKEDLKVTELQLDELSNAATPPDVFFTHQEKQWRVLSLDANSVTCDIIDKDFEFGDGYYEFHIPTNVMEITFTFEDSLLLQIVNDINDLWEEESLDYLHVTSFRKEYIEMLHRRNLVKNAQIKIEKSIETTQKYFNNSQNEEDTDNYEKEIDFLQQIYVALETKDIDLVERKTTKRELRQRQESKTKIEIFFEVAKYFQENPLSDEELKKVDVLYESEHHFHYTFEYTQFEWKYGVQDWSLTDGNWMNSNLIYKQWLVHPDGSKYVMKRDPRNIVIEKEVQRRLECKK